MTAKRWKPGNLVYVKYCNGFKERLDAGHLVYGLLSIPGISPRDARHLIDLYEAKIENTLCLIVDYAPEYDSKTGELVKRHWKLLVDEKPVWVQMTRKISPDVFFARPKKFRNGERP